MPLAHQINELSSSVNWYDRFREDGAVSCRGLLGSVARFG